MANPDRLPASLVPGRRTPPRPLRRLTPASLGVMLPMAITVLAGALLPAQFAVNTALAGEVGSLTLAATVSYAVGSLFLAALLSLYRTKPRWRDAGRAPSWAWLGGVVGSAYVVGSVVLTRALGAAVATTLVIAAQIVTAIALDHAGALGLPRRRINGARLLALLLALGALGLRLWDVR